VPFSLMHKLNGSKSISKKRSLPFSEATLLTGELILGSNSTMGKRLLESFYGHVGRLLRSPRPFYLDISGSKDIEHDKTSG